MVARTDALTARGRSDVRLRPLFAARSVRYFGLLVLLSLIVRTQALDAPFWIDEALSVGISSQPLSELPTVLRQDGSPPLYYALLHVWIAVAGSSEAATHTLSLAFALLTVPAAFWSAATFGARAAWICAVLAALSPFLTAYAQETRMYTLVALLSVLATGAFLRAFVLGRRRYVPVLALLLTLLLFTHNWAVFFALGMGAAFLVALRGARSRRLCILDGVAAFGIAAVLFAPWLPTLLFQARHTGAPWSTRPTAHDLLVAPSALFSGDGPGMTLILAGGAGIAGVLATRTTERRAILATIVLAAATLVAAWVASQIEPAWTGRYLAVVLGPLLLLAGVGLAHAGRLGMVALALVLLLWATHRAPDRKSNVAPITAQVEHLLRPGDLVISTHPEQVPVLHYYLPAGLRYATTLGPANDPRLMDWRDALSRLRAADPAATLRPLLDGLPAGKRVLFVRPLIRNDHAWRAPWTGLVRLRTAQWQQLVTTDRRLRLLAESRAPEDWFKGIRAAVYLKRRV